MSEPTKLPLKLDDLEDPLYIMDSDGRMVMEMRGHGHLTLDEVGKYARFSVLAVNYYQRLVDALREFANFSSTGFRGIVRMKRLQEESRALLAEIDNEAANG